MSALRGTFLFALVLSALAGCHVGPQIGELAALRQPGGAHVVVAAAAAADAQQSGPAYEGELVAVRDDGVVLALRSAEPKTRLSFLGWPAITRLTATALPGFATRVQVGEPPNETALDRWRLVSRYPQGLSAELEAELLAAYGQESLDSPENAAR